ncbi:MAG: hypothetical protein HC837_03290 [Chloroflexaceae bacterium]|nr:hypothetical protein [Chloroflexaceae bacterium]
MVYFDTSYLCIRWDSEINSVLMEWKSFVFGNDFRQGLNKGLELAREKRASRWLADLRKLGVVSQEDQQWSNQDWFPRALAQGIRSMAIVVPENVVAKWSVERIMQKAEEQPLVVTYLASVEEARQWLRSTA